MTPTLLEALARDGHVFVAAPSMRQALQDVGDLSDWVTFTDSWEALAIDGYLHEQDRCRRRRHAVFTADRDGLHPQPHQPHYQSPDYNPLFGGIERWFEPVTPAVIGSRSLRTTLDFARTCFDRLMPGQRWRIEAHQFRIEATPAMRGLPTPEGVHRDGVNYVLVLMIGRHNVDSGTTTIHSPQGAPLGSFTLTQPFDAVLLDDTRVYHGVTPITPVRPAEPAYRDVLVVTFRKI